MCGRYTLFTSEEYRDILQIIEEVGKRFPDQPVKTGEIYPTNRAPVLARWNAGTLRMGISAIPPQRSSHQRARGDGFRKADVSNKPA